MENTLPYVWKNASSLAASDGPVAIRDALTTRTRPSQLQRGIVFDIVRCFLTNSAGQKMSRGGIETALDARVN
jgi:hypothetical protein